MGKSAKLATKLATAAAEPATPELVPRPDGRGALLTGGVPGHRGAGGRPPDEFKRRMMELATYAERAGYVEQVLEDPDHPHWLGAWKFVTEKGYPELVKGDINVTVNQQNNTYVWKIGDREVPVR